MPKLKAGKPRAPVSGTDVVNDIPIRPQMFHLNSIPIAAPWHEKEMFEAGEFTRKLNPDFVESIVLQKEDDLWRRIIEVYWLCYQSADSTDSRLSVVRDFAAYFPDCLFDAWWIKELVKREHPEHSFSKSQKEILDRIQTGLRRPVKAQPRKSAVQEYYYISGVKYVKDNIQNDLSKWNDGLQRQLAPTPDWITEQVTQKVCELAQEFSIRDSLAKQRLTEFLEAGLCYKAAILIASKIYHVQEHDLQSKLE